MMTDFRRRFWTVVGIILLSIVVVALIWWPLSLARDATITSGRQLDKLGARCAPIVDETKLASFVSAQDQVKVATPDYGTLVKLVGLIRYNNNDNHSENNENPTEANETAKKLAKFIPLRLNNVTRSSGRSNGDTNLVLWTECAKLTLNLASDYKQLIVGSIELESGVKLGDRRRECQVQSTSIKLTDINRRYYCNEPANYECKSGFWHGNDTFVMKTIAVLEIYSLEFELDGNSTIIRTNQFSKRPDICGGGGGDSNSVSV